MYIQLNRVSFFVGDHVKATAWSSRGAEIVFNDDYQVKSISEESLRDMLKACQMARKAYKAVETEVPDVFDD